MKTSPFRYMFWKALKVYMRLDECWHGIFIKIEYDRIKAFKTIGTSFPESEKAT